MHNYNNTMPISGFFGNLDFFRRESADSRTGKLFLSADAEVQTLC